MILWCICQIINVGVSELLNIVFFSLLKKGKGLLHFLKSPLPNTEMAIVTRKMVTAVRACMLKRLEWKQYCIHSK